MLIEVNNHMDEFKKCQELSNEGLIEYFPPELISCIVNKIPPEDMIYKIIYNYMVGEEEKINVEELIKRLSKYNIETFYYTPIIIFILEKRYNKYFKKEEKVRRN